MKNKRLKLNVIGVIGILSLFIISLFSTSFQPIAKIGAILIYAGVSYASLMEEKRKGNNIEKSTLFTVAVILAITYLLFFI